MMTIPQMKKMFQDDIQTKSMALEAINLLQAQNEQLQQQIKELEHGSSTTETTTEGQPASAKPNP